jgi:hypothetical protein
VGFSDAWGGRQDAADAGFATGVVGFSDAWDGGGDAADAGFATEKWTFEMLQMVVEHVWHWQRG